jgi:hypothetical protein
VRLPSLSFSFCRGENVAAYSLSVEVRRHHLPCDITHRPRAGSPTSTGINSVSSWLSRGHFEVDMAAKHARARAFWLRISENTRLQVGSLLARCELLFR